MNELIEEPMFSIHKSLLRETLEAYHAGFYRLCTYSLFSIFDYIISAWYIGNIKKDEIVIHTKPNIYRRYEKIAPFAKKKEEQAELMKIFGQSVFRVHQTIFRKSPKELNKKLNRHSIIHGFHHYDSIKQEDVLKLFQLLKSCLVLRWIDKEDFEENPQV